MDFSFTPPGIITVSEELADRLIEFYEGMEKKMIPIIFFSPESKHRVSESSPWIDDGPTYNIGLLPVEDVPQNALKTYKNGYFVIDIPEENWRESHYRLLDFEPRGNKIILK